MIKKFISTAAALSLCAALATTVSAELNYTNARPTDTQTVDFNEAETGTVTNTSPITVKYTNDGAVRIDQNKYDKVTESGTTPEIKAGVFGKTADDKLLYAPKTDGDASKTTSFRMEFNGSANGSWLKGYAAGDKIKQSFQLAFDKNATDAYTYSMQITGTPDGQNATATVPVNNGFTTVFASSKSNVQFFSKNYPMNFLDSKWYNVEIVYTVGSEKAKNSAKLYIDGKYIASAEFTLSKDTSICVPMFGITQIRNNFVYPNGQKALPNGNYQTGIGHYFDNMVWSGKGSDFAYNEIVPVSNNAAIKVADGIVILNGAATADDVKNAITAGDNTVTVVSATDGKELSGDASAEGAMLKITSSVSGDIFYKIGKSAMLYSEDFEAADGFAEGQPYKYWETFNLEYAPDSVPAIVENIGGKSGKSFAVKTDSTVSKIEWTSVGSVTKGKKKVISHVADENTPLVIEAMFNNTQRDYVSSMLRVGYMIGGEQYEANSISVAANSVINCCNIDIAKAKKQGLWQKVALVIDPKTLTADIYLDGVKMNKEPQAVIKDPKGELDGISTMWLRTWSANTKLIDGYSAFDDIKIYNGYYDAEKDMPTVSSINDAVTVENGIISILATYNPTTLKKALSMADGTTVKFYTDSSFTTECKAVLPITTGAWMAEYAPGGSIHYYQIVTPKGVSSFETPKLYIDGIEVNELPELAEGEKAGLQAVMEMNKWNDEDETACVLALYDDAGTLVNLATVRRGGTGYNRVELNIRDITSFEGITVKAYVWNDLGGLVPVTDMVEIK